MFVRWFSGAVLGTLIMAVTSPLFVRSYLPRELNRGVWTLPAGESYRWRGEGYATTAIGPFGMPGKTSLDVADREVRRIALWGDSQAEGVCVNDELKIFAVAERSSNHRLAVFPLAQSGDNAGHWIAQMAWAESELRITDHVFLIVELSDLVAGEPLDPPPSYATQWAAANLPAFVIAAIRNTVISGDGRPRSLRFRPGPIATGPIATKLVAAEPTSESQPGNGKAGIALGLRKIRESAKGSITILYAPKLPNIRGKKIVTHDDHELAFAQMRLLAAEQGIDVVDLRTELIASGTSGEWPHGFQNGQIGVGHLNGCGNTIVAHAIVDHFR